MPPWGRHSLSLKVGIAPLKPQIFSTQKSEEDRPEGRSNTFMLFLRRYNNV